MAVNVICDKCRKAITRRMKANIWKEAEVVCTECLNLLRSAEQRQEAACRLAGKPNAHWLVLNGSWKMGPYSTHELIEFLRQGRIRWEAEICREGMATWTPVARLFTIPELAEGRLELRDMGQGDGTYRPPFSKLPTSS